MSSNWSFLVLYKRSSKPIIEKHLLVPNTIAEDSCIAGVYEKLDKSLINKIKNDEIIPKPLLICSGGTSSRCANDSQWTLDLRKNYRNIIYDKENKFVDIGGGTLMSSILSGLLDYGRTFPIGLSGLTGTGYILTGGISPISRSRGLAIDQIIRLKGYWGNGDAFELNLPTQFSSSEDKLKWKGLLGAAPFLGIVTEIRINSIQNKKLMCWQEDLDPDQLAEIIYEAENWPNSSSFHWVLSDTIRGFIVIELDGKSDSIAIESVNNVLKKNIFSKISIVKGLIDLPQIEVPTFKLERSKRRIHSEVLGVLGPPWRQGSYGLIQTLVKLIKKRPNPHCYIAAQQLGGVTSLQSKGSSSFIHRDAVWKPWITGSWEAGNKNMKDKSIDWIEEVWEELEKYCPGIHLAQMHDHLPWHKREIEAAFGEWLPGLQELKRELDPKGLLPPL